MKLAIQVKILPTREQAIALIDTLHASNKVANKIGEIAREHNSFGQYKLHKLAYHLVRSSSELSAQMVIRAISKVADAYKINKQRKHIFKPLGSIAYDDRILSWDTTEVSIWTTNGRKKIPFTCNERAREMLKSRKGESDLVYRNGKFFLLATVEVEEPSLDTPEDWLGVDLGIVNLATDSDNETFTSEKVEKSRKRYERIRAKLQSRGTKSAKRHLKKLAKRERRMKRDTNHVISKRLVEKAKSTSRGISLEDLQGIRQRSTVRKAQRSRHSKWAFFELRKFIEYKARLNGVAVTFVDPAYSSQECSECGHTEKANRKSRDKFVCGSCGFVAAADHNASCVIRNRAAINQPTVGTNIVYYFHFVTYKPTNLSVGS